MKIEIKDIIIVLLLNFLFFVGFSLIPKKMALPIGLLPVLILAVFVLLFKFLFGDNVKGYGFKKFNFGEFKSAIYMLLFIMPIAFLARLVAPGFDVFYAERMGLDTLLKFTMFNLFLFFPLLKEELIERIIQNKLSKAYGSTITIIFLSINFGLAHFFLFNIFFGVVSAIGIALGSVMIAALYEKTRNIILTFVVHILYDIIIVYQIYLHVFTPVLEWVYWGILMLLFLLVLKKGWAFLKSAFTVLPRGKMSFSDWVFLIIFLVWPFFLFIFYW